MNMIPQVKNLELIQAIKPSMRYDSSKESFAEWQKKARQKLIELCGIPSMKKCDPMFNIEFAEEFDTFTETRFTIQTEENYFLPAHLWVPKGKEGKLPLCICLQGHSKGMHISMGRPKYEGDEVTISGGDRDFAPQIVKEGFIALVIEQRNFGECGGTEKGPNCYVSSMAAILNGRTTIGERVWDISRTLDAVLENFDMVDEANIYCMGNSGGGTATFYASCIDERISLSMPSCAVCTYKHSIAAMNHCACNFIPNIAKYFDMGDLAGLIAPRKFILVHGVQDRIFPEAGVYETFDIVKKMFEAAGVPYNCRLVSGEEGHRFYAAKSWPVVHELTNK